jgi:hypothetical protein
MKYHEIPVKTLFIFHIFGGVHYRNQVVRMQAETHASTKKFGKNIWQHVGWSENGVPPTPLVNHHFPSKKGNVRVVHHPTFSDV